MKARDLFQRIAALYAQIKFNTLKGQLADIGVAPADITYLALSHSHFDHIGAQKALLWIGHSTAFFKDAIKSPGWYE